MVWPTAADRWTTVAEKPATRFESTPKTCRFVVDVFDEELVDVASPPATTDSAIDFAAA